jgi:hypothetical protein
VLLGWRCCFSFGVDVVLVGVVVTVLFVLVGWFGLRRWCFLFRCD